MIENLNLTTNKKECPSRAVQIDTRKDVNYYETLCLYCANNDVSLHDVSDDEFMAMSDLIQDYSNADVDQYDYIYFWID